MPLTEQNANLAGSPEHRWQYNGKEKVPDLGWYEYGFRWYAPDRARFLQVDPLATQYPYKSTYDYAENRPVTGIDLDGLEFVHSYQAQTHLLMNYPRAYYNSIKYGKGVSFDALANVVNGSGNFNRIVGAFGEAVFAERLRNDLMAGSFARNIFSGNITRGMTYAVAGINIYMSTQNLRYKEIDVLQTARVGKGGTYSFPLLKNLSGKEETVTKGSGDYTFLYEVKTSNSTATLGHLNDGILQLIEIMQRNGNNANLIPILVTDKGVFERVMDDVKSNPLSQSSIDFIKNFNNLVNQYHGGISLENGLVEEARNKVIEFKTSARREYRNGSGQN